MKKFLKVLIIVLLVLGAVGGTTYFFFKNNKKKSGDTGSLVNMLTSQQKLDFNNDLRKMRTIVNSDLTDNRLTVIIETNDKLDQVVYGLLSYYLDTNTTINNIPIKEQLDVVNANRALLGDMIKEYNIKKDSVFFDRHLGANDFYKNASVYLVEYAKFTDMLNDYTKVNNKNADIKFAMIEVYTDVVENTFSKVVKNAKNLNEIENASNISLINDKMFIDNSYIQSTQAYTANASNFVKYYNNCNKQNFASSLANNVTTVTSAEQANNELIATYYFKLIFGI